MKLKIRTIACESDDVLARNIASCPDLPEPAGSGHLAVVGGGWSVTDHLNDIKAHDDVWAINGACGWLREQGIDAALLSVDPSPHLIPLCEGARRAVLAPHCDPGAFEALAGADVTVPRCTLPGPTTAVAASCIALQAGFDRVTWYGCEGSFGETTHVFKAETPDLIEVECGGELFLTKMEFIVQAEQLANIIRAFPERFSARGDGFLGALVEHGDYDVTRVPRRIVEDLQCRS